MQGFGTWAATVAIAIGAMASTGAWAQASGPASAADAPVDDLIVLP